MRRTEALFRSVSVLLAAVLLLSFTGCGFPGKKPRGRIDYTAEDGSVKEPASTFGDIKEEAEALLGSAREAMDEGRGRIAVHFASLALARVSAIRYFVDNILWLNGEGKEMTDLTGTRYADWNEIASLNYASVYPLYCQYLLWKMQGYPEEAQKYLDMAERNPECPQYDEFYDWKWLSVRELYDVKKRLEAIEDEILSVYAPSPDPIGDMTGYEFSVPFLVTVGETCIKSELFSDAYRASEWAINADPFDGGGYFLGAMTAYAEKDYGKMQDYLLEGFENDPQNADINVLLALIARESGNTDTMREHIALAKEGKESEFSKALLAELEGGS